MSLVKRQTSTTASSSTGSAGGKFKFQYKQRTADEVKERARQTSGRDSYIEGDVQFFTPAEGVNTVRILPPPPDADWGHYGMRVWEHRDIGVDKGAYLCLAKMKHEPCPVCEERERASAAGEKDLAWDLGARCKTLLYVIDRKNPQKGPLLWNISAGGKKSMDTDLLNLSIDPSDGQVLAVDAPDDGFDLTMTRAGTGLTTAYSGKSFSRRASPISDTPELQEKWLRHVIEHRIDSKLVWHDYDYVKHALEGQPMKQQQSTAGGEEREQTAQQQPEKTTKLQRRGAPKEPEPQQQEQSASGDESLPTWDDLKEMNEDALAGLVEMFKLEPPNDGFDSEAALRTWVAEQLGVEVPKAAPTPAAGGSWKERLKSMQGAKS